MLFLSGKSQGILKSDVCGSHGTTLNCFFFRVYDPDTRKIVQKNLGHSDSVRCIVHIPERSQVL